LLLWRSSKRNLTHSSGNPLKFDVSFIGASNIDGSFILWSRPSESPQVDPLSLIKDYTFRYQQFSLVSLTISTPQADLSL
jgi:hypothetical protein